MTAVIPQSSDHYVVFSEMPFARNLSSGRSSFPFSGYGESTKTAREAECAILRFTKNNPAVERHLLPDKAQSFMLDSIDAVDDLRVFAKTQGMDFDELVAGASVHFGSSSITRRTEPLTTEELGCLFEDDQRALGHF